jgi:hypothetical protein
VNPVVLGVGEQSSASGMALYSDFRYAIHSEFLLGYLAMFIACLALICALSSYTSSLLRPDDLGKDISSLCFSVSVLPDVRVSCRSSCKDEMGLDVL